MVRMLKGLERMSAQPFAPCDFEMAAWLGRGSFGDVAAVVESGSRRVVAMKMLEKKVIIEKGMVDQTKLERAILKRLKHPFLAGLKFAFQTEEALYLGMPFYFGSLDGARARCVSFYACELALGIGHLHMKGLVHRDLKPSNILVDRRGHVAIADFGLCSTGGETKVFAGTIEYVAPEVLQKGGCLTKAVDWWSLGCVLYELATGQTPFRADTTRGIFTNILRARAPRTDGPVDALLCCLLEKDPASRLQEVDAVKNHAYFGGVDWDHVYRKGLDPPLVPPTPAFIKEEEEDGVPLLADDATLTPLDTAPEAVAAAAKARRSGGDNDDKEHTTNTMTTSSNSDNKTPPLSRHKTRHSVAGFRHLDMVALATPEQQQMQRQVFRGFAYPSPTNY